MSIDPKKGGQCWSCQYCEDIATQTNNPSGAYYRKCNRSGHDYVDTCKFYCSDYIWDGKTEKYHLSSSSSSSSSSYSSSESSSGIKKWIIIAVLVVIAIAVYIMLSSSSGFSKGDADTPLGTTSSSGDNQTTYSKAVVNTSSQSLSMREQPTTKSDVICGIPKGTVVTVIEQQEDWWYVEYNGKKGWCSAKYLSLE